ncbi:hypothetical protein APR11_001308 [Nocardia amikacinitolerans]|nr:hypothetical protein [Nocardia amikacinitolerans]
MDPVAGRVARPTARGWWGSRSAAGAVRQHAPMARSGGASGCAVRRRGGRCARSVAGWLRPAAQLAGGAPSGRVSHLGWDDFTGGALSIDGRRSPMGRPRWRGPMARANGRSDGARMGSPKALRSGRPDDAPVGHPDRAARRQSTGRGGRLARSDAAARAARQRGAPAISITCRRLPGAVARPESVTRRRFRWRGDGSTSDAGLPMLGRIAGSDRSAASPSGPAAVDSCDWLSCAVRSVGERCLESGPIGIARRMFHVKHRPALELADVESR